MFNFSLPLLSGLLLYLSSPGPGIRICAWFAIVPLLYACRRTKPSQSALAGFLAGIFYYTLLLRWVTISLENYGNLPWWIAWPTLLLLAAYMSCYLALFSWIMSSSLKMFRQIWTAPVVWVGLDTLRGFLFSGFPWQDLGYSQYADPTLIQAADLFGHHGITFLIILINTVIFSLTSGLKPFFRKKEGLGLRLPYPLYQSALALILGTAVFGYSFYQENHFKKIDKQPGLSTAVIQGSINQEEKWLPGTALQTIEKYLKLSLQAVEEEEPELMIWPETAIPYLRPDGRLMQEIRRQTVESRSYSLITGMPYFTRTNGKIDYYNSALLLQPYGPPALYHKQHLVPFGEYIPFKELLNLPGPLVESIGNFSAGKSSAPLTSGKARVGMLICFESIFPELARKEVGNGANLLVNITNDAWFGHSSATVQHMAMAVFRAVENRRSLARAANTGISCFILPSGRIKKATPLFEPLYITAELPLLQNTTVYSRYGWLFAPACLILTGGLFLWLLHAGRTKRSTGDGPEHSISS